MRRRLLAVALGMGLLVLLLAACGGEGASVGSEEAGGETIPGGPGGAGQEAPPTVPAGVGSGPGYYETPVPVSEGEWTPPVFAEEGAFERGWAAEEEEAARPEFHGTVNDFAFLPDGDPALRSIIHCDITTSKEAASDTPLPYEITYLPPGTAEEGPPYVLLCPDGLIGRAARFFTVQGATLAVSYFSGEPVIDSFSSADRVEGAIIQGRPGVVVRPLTPEGYGSGLVGFRLEEGFITVRGRHLPLDELMKVAEGIECAGC